MGKQIRNLGLFLTACYVALFVQLNRLTVFDAEDLRNKPGNTREAERDFDRPRGSISTADGVVIAESIPATDGRRFELQRNYPTGDLFGQITGYYNPLFIGSDGLEKQYDDELAGDDRPVRLDNLDDLFDDYFVDKEHVGNMTLTMRNDVQVAAREALAGQQGSIVVMNPQTGGILAMYSNPTYDPNPLATHDGTAATQAKEAFNAMGRQSPLIAHAYQEVFPPGSTFKVVTGSAGVDSGQVTPEEPVYDVVREYQAPGAGTAIPNFGGSPCGGTLFEILQRSCNTSFAQMGVDIGAPPLTGTAEALGFNRELPLDLPRVATSRFPVERAQDRGFRAQIAIGQNDVAAAPLQMALVASAVANNGRVMSPHVMAEIRDEEEQVIKQASEDDEFSTAMSDDTAETMREAMMAVVADGTAERLDDGLEQFQIGGKTGTAQREVGAPHAWIIGFAGPPGQTPTVAIAVIIEGAEGVSDDQTGGRVAAPIANQVLRVALEGQPPAGN